MRKYLSILILVLLLIGCGLKRIQPKSHIYKDLSFGMSYEEVSSKGYCVGQQAEEDGYSTYKCKFSDMQGFNTKRQSYVLRRIDWQKFLFISLRKMLWSNKSFQKL